MFVCMDGTQIEPPGQYCGVGRCNIFGCNCDGGCRSNPEGTKRRAQELAAERYHVELDL